MSRRYRSESIEVVTDDGVWGAGGFPARRDRRCYVVGAIVRRVEAMPWWTGASGQRQV